MAQTNSNDPMPVPASAFTPNSEIITQDVFFNGYNNALLAGTLQKPRGAGPFPVVITIGGSGPQVRGGFKVLTEKLIERGVAIFEYDKRGSGKSGGTRIETIPALATDLKAAIVILRQRRDIDGWRVALIGGSQGGAVAPAVAADDPTIRGVVMLAGPTIDGDKVFLNQVTPQLRNANASPAIQKRQVRLIKSVLRIVQTNPKDNKRRNILQNLIFRAAQEGLVPLEAVDPIVAAFSDPSLYGGVTTVRPKPILKKIRCPILTLFAANDVLVSSKQNMPVAKMALRNNPDATVVEIAGVNHLFQLGDASFAEAKGYPYSAPEVSKVVVPWLLTRLQVAP